MAVNLKKTSLKQKMSRRSALPFTRENYILFFIGVALILIGYVALASGTVNGILSLTLAPIILCLGYLIAIPAALIYRKKNGEDA